MEEEKKRKTEKNERKKSCYLLNETDHGEEIALERCFFFLKIYSAARSIGVGELLTITATTTLSLLEKDISYMNVTEYLTAFHLPKFHVWMLSLRREKK